MEKRLLLAFVLSMVFLAVWGAFFGPKEKVLQQKKGEITGEGQASAEGTSLAEETSPHPETIPAPEPTQGEPGFEAILETEGLRLAITSNGGAVRSAVLLGYEDDEGRPLELVQKVKLPDKLLPLQLLVGDKPDDAIYSVRCSADSCDISYSDGLKWAVKKIRVLDRYSLEVSVRVGGNYSGSELAVGTGMRNIGKREAANRFATWGDVAGWVDGKLKRLRRKKVKSELELTDAAWAGFEDTYFLSLLLPQDAGAPLGSVKVKPLGDPKDPVLRVTVPLKKDSLDAVWLLAPKEYDLLKEVDRGVDRTLHFGIFHPISVLFLKTLRWIHSWCGNWGFAIVILTVAIRILLFPLMHKSTVSMRKMQKLQPKIRAIQEKYKRHKNDPEARARMNQELMEAYRAEGVNPMGGCLPMLVQIPILFALYTVFAYAIELRHAPFILWIRDLSAKDPYYVTPVLMTFTMWLQQKLAPQAGDPQQQRFMRMMPLIFGLMFLGFPSGLVLYWLVNNVLSIIQQEITLTLLGERKDRRKRQADRRRRG